jgi:hypothetical protein
MWHVTKKLDIKAPFACMNQPRRSSLPIEYSPTYEVWTCESCPHLGGENSRITTGPLEIQLLIIINK